LITEIENLLLVILMEKHFQLVAENLYEGKNGMKGN